MPAPLGAEAPATAFSAGRAEDVLARLLGPELPHPVSSAEATAVRERIINEFAALGIMASVREGNGAFYRPILRTASCATVKDIVAEVVPGQGPAIILLAHYDSVPAGPGAADDEAGVAAILEVVRAIKSRNARSEHPIVAVITDGEEAGLLGAEALMDSPEFRERIGAVINLEARGNAGPSLLFQTSPGDSPMIDVYKRSVDRYATSSLFPVIYKLLPNDTDLTPVIDAGFPAFNFAFSGNVAHYHTPLDRRENLDRASLQHQGDNVLGVVSSLESTSFASLRGGSDDVYVPLLSRWLPRVPVAWTLPLSIVALLLLGATIFFARAGLGGFGGWARAVAVVPLMLLGCAGAGFLLHLVAALVSGQPDPSYAYPTAMRLSFGAGVFTVFLACSRLADPKRAALAIWIWMVLLSLVTSLLAPGVSPYFLFPSLIAGVALIAQARSPEAWSGRLGHICLAVAALLPLLYWMGLVVIGESIGGLAIHPLFTLPAALALLPLIPLAGSQPGTLWGSLSKRAWRTALAGCFAVALLLGVFQGTRPAYSQATPQRLNIAFVDDHEANQAYWFVDTRGRLPASVRSVAQFSESSMPLYRFPGYKAPAGAVRFPASFVEASQQPTPAGRTVTLAMKARDGVANVVLLVPGAAGLRAYSFNGVRHEVTTKGVAPNAASGDITLWCMSADCAHATLVLEVTAPVVDLSVATLAFGLPADGQKLVAARPDEAVPSQNGDVTIVTTKVHI